MSESMLSRRDRREARRWSAVAQRAERQMTDHRFDRIRTPRGRRVLAAALIGAVALTSGLFSFGRTGLAVVALVMSAALWVLLRVAVRAIADLPAEFLDERQERVRNQAYVDSYRWLAAVAVLGLGAARLAVGVTGTDPGRISVTITIDQIQAVFWLAMGMALALPSLVVALREPSI